MLIEFSFGNFRSFRDEQKLSMLAAPLRTNDSGLEEGNVFTKDEFRLLKSKAIIGQNASGKSNVTEAMSAFQQMVVESVKDESLSARIWRDRFGLITNWDEEPVFFQGIFVAGKSIFRYGFSIVEGLVSEEWLFGQGSSRKEENLFRRTSNGLKVNRSRFPGADQLATLVTDDDNEIFRNNSLFLTSAALLGNKLAIIVRNSVQSLILVDGIWDYKSIGYALERLEKGTSTEKVAIKSLLRTADTGIEDLQFGDVPEELLGQNYPPDMQQAINNGGQRKPRTLFSVRTIYNEEGGEAEKVATPFASWESDGTRKLLGVGSLVLNALDKGRPLIIDEFDARFHPNLTLKIVELFHSPKTNPRGAQLIFVTHDTGLLRRARLRRDQICLVDKDKYGISSLRSLIEYKGVRKDASYEKEYLQGSYGGVPYLAQMDWVVSDFVNEPDVISSPE